MAVEAPAPKVLSLFGSGVVRMLNGETGMGGEVSHCHWVALGRWRLTVERVVLGGNHDGSCVFELDVGVVIEVVVRRMRRVGHGRDERLLVSEFTVRIFLSRVIQETLWMLILVQGGVLVLLNERSVLL